MRSGRRLLKSLTILVVVAGVAVAAYVAIDRRGTGGAEVARERPAVPVEVAPVEAMTLEETVRGVGTLRAVERVEVRPEVAGRIREIGFEEGGVVEEEQLLFKIDDQKLRQQLAGVQASLRAAEVRMADAQRVFDRIQQLRERDVAPQEEFAQARVALDRARAEREGVQAELALIEERVRDTDVRAPFTGVISEREVDRGAFVTVGQRLATLYRTDLVEITFAVPERHMGRIVRGQTVQVTLAAYPGRVFEGVVNFISPAVDEITRSFQVKAEIPNPRRQLMPGAFATALVTVDVRESRPVVPEESLVATRRGYMVFLVEEERARSREVSTGLRREGMVEVLEGLAVGDVVVRTGHLRLSGGDRVAIAGVERIENVDHHATHGEAETLPIVRNGSERMRITDEKR